MQGEVEEGEGLAWRCSTSTEMLLIHGMVDGELPVSMMAAAAPACSRHKEEVGELGLG